MTILFNWLGMKSTAALDSRSKSLRATLIRECLLNAKRGHLGPSFSVIDILRVLYDDIMTYDASKPEWKERDRLILSKGHGGLALYTLLADKGFIPSEWLSKFCAFDGKLGVHPDYFKVPGVEASTGSLGHGPSIGIGMALQARREKRKSHIYVVIGDGESQEGSVWEAALCAGKYGLDNLTVIVDYNKQQGYGDVDEIQPMDSYLDKFNSFGFASKELDGHDVNDLKDTFQNLPLEKGKPSAIICHTIKGKGLQETENNIDWHHQNKMDADKLNQFLKELETANA